MGWGRFKFFVSSSSFSKFCVRILFKFPFGCILIFKLWLQNCILHFLHFLFIILCFSPLGLARFKFFFLRIHLQIVAFKLLFEKTLRGDFDFQILVTKLYIAFFYFICFIILYFPLRRGTFQVVFFLQFCFSKFCFQNIVSNSLRGHFYFPFSLSKLFVFKFVSFFLLF